VSCGGNILYPQGKFNFLSFLCPEGGDKRDGWVALFYKYVGIVSPDEQAEWQKALCQQLGLTGKLRIAHEGINGTLVHLPLPFYIALYIDELLFALKI